MHYLEFKNKKVAYYVHGSGLPLVLLHGFCEDSTIWNDFILDLPDYQVIRIDLSGFGKSEILPENSIELMAESVHAVLSHLVITQCVLVGHSMGGYVATAFAEKYTEMVTGLGYFHSHAFADSDEKKDQRQKSIEFIHKHGHAIYVKQLIPKLFANLFATSNEFLINRLIHNAIQYPTDAITGALEAMINRPDRSSVVEHSKFPVLFIIGMQDDTVPYDISLKQTYLPAVADIHILPKVAHMGMFRSKDVTVKIVRNFMEFCYPN